MLAHFRRGKYIVAVQKEGQQIPILREKDGQMYQPLFTDIQEFNKFNKEKNLKAAIIGLFESAKISGAGGKRCDH